MLLDQQKYLKKAILSKHPTQVTPSTLFLQDQKKKSKTLYKNTNNTHSLRNPVQKPHGSAVTTPDCKLISGQRLCHCHRNSRGNPWNRVENPKRDQPATVTQALKEAFKNSRKKTYPANGASNTGCLPAEEFTLILSPTLKSIKK